MLVAKSIHHQDYTNIQHITQEQLVQLALSGARGYQNNRLIFHHRQPAEAHVKFLSHSPGRKAEAEQRLFHSFFQSHF